MSTKILKNQEWRKFHDSISVERIANVQNIHCVDGAESIIELLKAHPTSRKLKAAGSHWALSDVTVSDADFVETNWPGSEAVPRNSGVIDNLHEIISQKFKSFLVINPPATPESATEDPCLSGSLNHIGNAARDILKNTNFFVHLKSGTRIYEAYALLDKMDREPTTLAKQLNLSLANQPNMSYLNPWAFETLGGAGGQTVFGALTTGTHGGDYGQRPIADCVVAMHLVREDGDHFWIERETQLRDGKDNLYTLTEDSKLRAAYDNLVPGTKFHISRDDALFNSVLIGGGRFGVVASLVLRVVPQYCLQQHRRLDSWFNIKSILNNGNKHFNFDAVYFAGPDGAGKDKVVFQDRFKLDERAVLNVQNRFFQIAISVIPRFIDEHTCGVTQRWFYPYDGVESKESDQSLRGRRQRGVFNNTDDDTAGRSSPYSPPEFASADGTNSTFLSRACSDGSFLEGILKEALKEIEKIISNNGIAVGGATAGLFAIGAGPAILALASACAALLIAAAIIKKVLDALGVNTNISLADAIGFLIEAFDKDVQLPRIFKVLVLRFIFNLIFKTQQSDRDFVALSYAVMDGHDYKERSCTGNVASIEVFMDADRPDLYCAYVDQILAYEAWQEEQEARFSIGYVSLRFIRKSQGLIAPARFENTVVIEAAGVKDISGSKFFVDNAARVALSPMYNASLHWGQENSMTKRDVERVFNAAPTHNLDVWKKTLSKFNQGTTGKVFSSEFTRNAGLEPI